MTDCGEVSDHLQLIYVIKNKMRFFHEASDDNQLQTKIVTKPNSLRSQVCWLNIIDYRNIWLFNCRSFGTNRFIQILGFKHGTFVLSVGMRTTKFRVKRIDILLFLRKTTLRFGSNCPRSLLLTFPNDHFKQVFDHNGGNLE